MENHFYVDIFFLTFALMQFVNACGPDALCVKCLDPILVELSILSQPG